MSLGPRCAIATLRYSLKRVRELAHRCQDGKQGIRLAGIGRRRLTRIASTPPPALDHPATSFGPRRTIATSNATPVDHPTIANVSGTARKKIAPHHLRFFSKNRKAIWTRSTKSWRRYYLYYLSRLWCNCPSSSSFRVAPVKPIRALKDGAGSEGRRAAGRLCLPVTTSSPCRS